MKKIKIFLGSSIVEFEKERNELELFIRNLSDKFEDNYNIKIVPLRCENIDNYVRADGTQSAINEELVRSSDMCFFIFFTKVGKYTEEEFRVALEKFKRDGKPKIYIYFKIVPDDVKIDDSVQDFMIKIDEELKHYHGSFDHIDTIKLRILLNLKFQEMDFITLKIENGTCSVDGNNALEIKNVNEFANNGVLQELNNELHKMQELYYQMRPIYDNGQYSNSFYIEYINISTKLQSLSASINELEKRIFEMSLNLCKDEVHGIITVRQKEAYRLFELGDYEGCLKVLDKDEINNDFFSFKKEEYEKIKRKAECFVREHLTAIHLLLTYSLERSIDYKEIEERYDYIIPVCKKYRIELNAIREYAHYLAWGESSNQNCRKALSLAHDLEETYLSESDTVSSRDWIELKLLFGYIYERLIGTSREYTSTYCLDKSLEYYAEAKNIIKSNKAEEDNLFRLPTVLNYIGMIYYEKEKYDLAEDCFFEALALMKNSFEKMDQPNYEELSLSYCMIGKCYSTVKEMEKAQEYFEKSLEICCKDEVSNKIWVINRLYSVYYAYGEFYLNNKKSEINKAELYLIKALSVNRILIALNPLGGSSILGLVKTLIALGEYYQDNPDTLYDETYYYDELKSLVENYCVLFESYPLIYRKMITKLYNCLLQIDKENNYAELTAQYIELLVSIYNQLEEPYYEGYKEDLLSVYNAAHEFYYSVGSHEKAADYMCKMISIEEQDNHFPVDITKKTTHYTWIASYYAKNHNIPLAVESYKMALDLAIDAVVGDEDDRFEFMIIYIYGEMGGLFRKVRNYKEARYCIKERIRWLKMVLYEDFDTYIPLLASAYLDLSKCCISKVKVHLYIFKALYYAFQCPDNEICKKIINLSKNKNNTDN